MSDRSCTISSTISQIAKDVADFHVAAGMPLATTPTIDLPEEIAKLRIRLISEELQELEDAVRRSDLPSMADALADIIYVVYGAALTYGIDLDAVLAEVHRSNMTKLNGIGTPILRTDGKVLKAPTYVPPDVSRILREQLPLSPERLATAHRPHR